MRQIQCKRCGAIISVSGDKYLLNLVSPDGTVYHVERLTDFVRKHISEFSEGSDAADEKAVNRAMVGLSQIIATANGANKGYPAYTYKGWKIAKKEGNDND